MKKRPPSTDDQRDEFYKAYEDYARALRTWLVAYGIGFPVLMLTNKEVSEALANSGEARCIAILFVGGVACQVVLAAMNKVCMWVCYLSESDPDIQGKLLARFFYKLSSQFWIDFLLDFLSITAFVIATLRLFDIYFPVAM